MTPKNEAQYSEFVELDPKYLYFVIFTSNVDLGDRVLKIIDKKATKTDNWKSTYLCLQINELQKEYYEIILWYPFRQYINDLSRNCK